MPKTVETRVGVCYNNFKYCTKGETGMLISLVVPCYNEEESLPIFYKEASKIAQQMGISHGADFEFIFVDDGSKDRTLQIARELHRKDARVRYISFSRNFGKGIFSWVGFKTKWIDYKNVERVAGTTKWNFWGLLKYSIEGIVGFSTAPLLMAAGLGLAFCVLAFVGIIIVVVRALMFGDPTSGWPSLVCIILLCSGVQLLCTGIAGEYLAKTYLETKHRPIYIAAETEEDLDAE